MASNDENVIFKISWIDLYYMIPAIDGIKVKYNEFARKCRDAVNFCKHDETIRKIAVTKLPENVRDLIEDKEYASVEAFLRDIRINFEKPIELFDLQFELKNIMQNYNEPVLVYASRFQKISKRIIEKLTEDYSTETYAQYLTERKEEENELIIKTFVRGLFDKIATLLMRKNIKTLQQAIQEASNIEVELKRREAQHQNRGRNRPIVEDNYSIFEPVEFQFSQTNSFKKFCEFHKNHSHETSECITQQKLRDNNSNNFDRDFFCEKNFQNRNSEVDGNYPCNFSDQPNSPYCQSQNYQNPQNYQHFSKHPQSYENVQNYKKRRNFRNSQNYQSHFKSNNCSIVHENGHVDYSHFKPNYYLCEKREENYLYDNGTLQNSRDNLCVSKQISSASVGNIKEKDNATRNENFTYEKVSVQEVKPSYQCENSVHPTIYLSSDNNCKSSLIEAELQGSSKETEEETRSKEKKNEATSSQQEVGKSLLREEQLKQCLLKQEKEQSSLKQKKNQSSSQPQEMEETSSKENYKEETSSKENYKEETSSKLGKIKRSSLEKEEKHSSEGKYKEDGIDTLDYEERSSSLKQEKVVETSTQPQRIQSSSQTNVGSPLQVNSTQFITRVYTYNEEEGKSSSQLIEKGPMWHKQNSSKQLIEKSPTRHTRICSMNIIENNASQQLRNGHEQNDEGKSTKNETANENQTIRLSCEVPSTLIGEVTVEEIFGDPPVQPTFRSPLMYVESLIDNGVSAHLAEEENDRQNVSNLNDKSGIPSVQPTFRSPNTPYKEHILECNEISNFFEPHFPSPTLRLNRKSINKGNIYHIRLKVQPNFRSPSIFNDKTTNFLSLLQVPILQLHEFVHNGLKMLYVFLRSISTIVIVQLYQLICSTTPYNTPRYQIIF